MLLAKKRYEGPMNQRSNLHSTIREVKEAKNELPKLVVKHLRREQNGVAHKLVQLAKRTVHAAAWYGRFSVCRAFNSGM